MCWTREDFGTTKEVLWQWLSTNDCNSLTCQRSPLLPPPPCLPTSSPISQETFNYIHVIANQMFANFIVKRRNCEKTAPAGQYFFWKVFVFCYRVLFGVFHTVSLSLLVRPYPPLSFPCFFVHYFRLKRKVTSEFAHSKVSVRVHISHLFWLLSNTDLFCTINSAKCCKFQLKFWNSSYQFATERTFCPILPPASRAKFSTLGLQ